MSHSEPAASYSSRRVLAFLLAGTALLFALRLAGPSNLTDNDQERPASYILDVLHNGHWIVQYDWTGDITSKPPGYTWLGAIAALAWGRLDRISLYLPCALALFGSAACVTLTAARFLSLRAAILAGTFLLANPLSAKLVALARTDPVFTFAVTLTATLVFRAWTRGHGWTAAWLAGAFATLVKGPLGIALGFAGLLAWFWERKRGARSPASKEHFLGSALWLLVCGGWFLLAWNSAGDALIRKMLGAELLQHAVGTAGSTPGSGLLLAPAYYFGRFLPWSALSVVGLAWAFLRPESAPEARLLQRFAAAWLVVGWVVFGLASHQRGDLIAPLMPAGAILAAIPVARWSQALSLRKLSATAAAVTVIVAVASHLQFISRTPDEFARSRNLEIMKNDFLRLGENPTKLRHVDAPFALQFHFGTMHRALGFDEAVRHLREGFDHTVAIADLPRLVAALGPDAPRLHSLVTSPTSPAPQVHIVALRPPSAASAATSVTAPNSPVGPEISPTKP